MGETGKPTLQSSDGTTSHRRICVDPRLCFDCWLGWFSFCAGLVELFFDWPCHCGDSAGCSFLLWVVLELLLYCFLYFQMLYSIQSFQDQHKVLLNDSRIETSRRELDGRHHTDSSLQRVPAGSSDAHIEELHQSVRTNRAGCRDSLAFPFFLVHSLLLLYFGRRNYYKNTSGARCNIVVCDDGMMALLKNNFAAAEMLWETIENTKGKVFKLSKLLQRTPRPSRRHLKGLSSHSVYEVFHRMLFYYHYSESIVYRIPDGIWYISTHSVFSLLILSFFFTLMLLKISALSLDRLMIAGENLRRLLT